MVRAGRIRNQKFRREHPVPPYTVDFVCLNLSLIIEVDGKDHFTDQGTHHDAIRDQFLREQGFDILRIDGYAVIRDPQAVIKRIEAAVDTRMG